MVSSSAALAPTLGGLVLAIAPWPWVFASAVPFAILSLILGRSLPAPRPRDEPFDVLGAVMCAAMFGLVIGGAETGVHGDSPVVSAAIILTGVAIGWVFVRRERGEAKPILPIDLLARPVLALSAIGAYTAFIASMTLLLSTPFLPPNARLIIGSAPRERAAAAGGLVSTIRLVGQTTGATLVAALLAMGIGAGPTPSLVAAGFALVAGVCSLSRLRPSIRNPAIEETQDVQPASQAR